MSNLTNKNLQRMRELMGKTPVNESISNSAVELVKKSPDGKAYGIVRENRKYFIKESNDGKNFDFIGGVANKPKYQYHSYEEAVRELNFMFEDLNKTFNVEKGTDILSSDIIEEKRFVLKSKKKSEPSSTPDFDFGNTGEDKAPDFDFGDTGEDKAPDFDFGKGDSDENMTLGDEDLSDEDDPIKSIQKMTGKLGQKIRDTEDLSSDTMKWVAKSIISALDLESMDSEDKKDIIRAVKKKEDEGSDEEFDFMGDDSGSSNILTASDLYGETDKDYMGDDDCPGCQGSGYDDEMEGCVNCGGTGVTDDTTLDWNSLSDEEKQGLVSTTYGGGDVDVDVYPGDNEKPMMDWETNNYNVDDEDNSYRRTGENQYMMFSPEEVDVDEEVYVGNSGLDYDDPDEDFMTDWMREDNPNIGGDEDIDGQLLFDEELPYDEYETETSGYPDFEEDWMSDDTYPYSEVNKDYMDDRDEDLYGNYTADGVEDIDNMTDYMNIQGTVNKMKGGYDEGHVDKLLRYVKGKLGGDVDIDDDHLVGDNYFIRIDRNNFTVEKGGSKKKYFNFDEIGKMVEYVKSKTDFMSDYMMDIDNVPSMMPKTAPSKPSTTPAPTTKPGKPDTDRPNPSKRPFTPPPYITPGEEPSPKAEYEDEFEEDYMDYMADDYGSNESMGYMEDDDTCPICNGTGQEKKIGFSTRPNTCIACAGTGRVSGDVNRDITNINNNGDFKYNYRERNGLDYMSDNDDNLPLNNRRFNPMSPKTAPSKPSTTPAPTTKPGKPDTDRPNPSKRPFTPPPYITPGEEPSPKARKKGKLVGNQYKLDMNDSGDLDSEDFRMLRNKKRRD